ncbi:hypothetical protein [Shewanella surugensis]|uniref:Uncharacterized protein n=1 Tax=Shewanella surugensis TaxID=212020 RepID=A0ABT0LBH6_9GAMM|nr:hypothetical protein [Shewanella surugensis]MCL1125047.1 hypothetical protein [Shewanella surugensis]
MSMLILSLFLWAIENKMKSSLSILFLASLMAAFPIIGCSNLSSSVPDTSFRLMLSAHTTIHNPSYFYCVIAPQPSFEQGGHPTLPQWTPPILFTPVSLMNYAQNVQGFTGLGKLATTADYINSHYFKSYHDPDFDQYSQYSISAGFIDAFVLWPGYAIECATFNASDINSHGEYDGRVLAGSDYN